MPLMPGISTSPTTVARTTGALPRIGSAFDASEMRISICISSPANNPSGGSRKATSYLPLRCTGAVAADAAKGINRATQTDSALMCSIHRDNRIVTGLAVDRDHQMRIVSRVRIRRDHQIGLRQTDKPGSQPHIKNL